jgi:hypothetical protein
MVQTVHRLTQMLIGRGSLRDAVNAREQFEKLWMQQ